MAVALIACTLASCAHLAAGEALHLARGSIRVHHFTAGSARKTLRLDPFERFVQSSRVVVRVRIVLMVDRPQKLSGRQPVRHLQVHLLVHVIVVYLYQRRVHGLRLDSLRATFRRLELLQVATARVALLTVGHGRLSLSHLTRVVEVLHAHIVASLVFRAIAEWLAVARAQRSLL